MPESDTISKLEEAVQFLTEAAILHIKLGTNSTEDAVKGALQWRYNLSEWVAEEVYKYSLRLLDKMPRSR